MAAYPIRLLIIENRLDSVSQLAQQLGREGFDHTLVRDGTDGLNAALAMEPDLILLGLDPPEPDGLEVCKQLKAEPAVGDIPLIFISTSGLLDDKLRGFACGAVDYFVTPFAPAEAVARIKVHVATRQRIERLEAMALQRTLEAVEGELHPELRLFQRAIARLEQSLATPISMDNVSIELGSYTRKLNDIFLRKTGMTMFEYHTEMRLETGRRLLEASGLQIQQIAHQVGYRNQGDFTRAFRRRYGKSPRMFRQANGDTADTPMPADFAAGLVNPPEPASP